MVEQKAALLREYGRLKEKYARKGFCNCEGPFYEVGVCIPHKKPAAWVMANKEMNKSYGNGWNR